MKKGYTLAEVLIALLIVAIVAAISAPILTKSLIRNKAASTKPWTWVGNAAYSSSDGNSVAMIGLGTIPTGNLPRLLINTDYNERNAIEFYYGNVSAGNLSINSQGTQIGNFVTSTYCAYNGIVSIGNNPNTGVSKGSNSVAIGENTAAFTEGVSIGTNARAGINSVALGKNASTFIEAVAIGENTNAANYAIAIGSDANAATPYSLAIGVNSTVSGNGSFVIGNNSTLDAANSILIAHNDSISSTHFYGYNPAGTLLLNFFTNRVIINGAPVIRGILHAPSNLYATSVICNNITYRNFSNTSDLRLKNLENEYTSSIDKLNQLKVYNYTFKAEPKIKRVGVVAQQLMKIFPDAVSKDANGYYTIRQEDIFYAMVNALKDFDKKIKTITSDIKKLNKAFASLEAKLEKLTKQTQKNSNDIESLKKEINLLELKINSVKGNN